MKQETRKTRVLLVFFCVQFYQKGDTTMDLYTQMMASVCKSNPEVMKIVKEIKESGMSAKDYFYKKAEEQGVDPDSILGKLR